MVELLRPHRHSIVCLSSGGCDRQTSWTLVLGPFTMRGGTEEVGMKIITRIRRVHFAAAIAAALVALLVLAGGAGAQQIDAPQVGTNSVGGVSNGQNGPDVSVWVIAETTQLPTRY